FLVLDQAVHQLGARVFLFLRACGRIARQQHLRFDVDQDRGHVDELGGDVDVEFAEAFHVRQVLGGDFRDGDVVDVNVLLADEIEQEVKGAIVNVADTDGEREVGVFSGGRSLYRSR